MLHIKLRGKKYSQHFDLTHTSDLCVRSQTQYKRTEILSYVVEALFECYFKELQPKNWFRTCKRLEEATTSMRSWNITIYCKNNWSFLIF